ncbi:phosphotransferase enzyme family protein [Nocardiopsis sp. NPDC050513]|uniref:phosphotransferase enzyme family protein n=1 Tax=Nocardiopsis sp. NPDC050513 TaxID=3364338 RepID=UPI0037A37B83
MSTTELRNVLSEAYGLTGIRLSRLASGSQTDNHRGDLPSGETVFVKAGRPDPGFRYGHAEAHSGAELSETARVSGVPAPAVRRNRAGGLVTRTSNGVLTVWDFIDADPQTDPLTPDRAEDVGRILGRLHTRFAELPAQARRQRGDGWIEGASGPLITRAHDLMSTIESLPHPSTADLDRRERLQRRVEHLGTLPELRRSLPRTISRGLGHGDYSRVNLLWRGDRVAGVLDFLGDDVPLAWELGRIAFDSLTVATSPTWRESALACAYGYRRANPHLSPDDFLAAPLMMALHALCSLYGVYEHYHRPNPVKEVQEDNTQYWTNRDIAVTTVLDELDALRADLADLL